MGSLKEWFKNYYKAGQLLNDILEYKPPNNKFHYLLRRNRERVILHKNIKHLSAYDKVGALTAAYGFMTTQNRPLEWSIQYAVNAQVIVKDLIKDTSLERS